jgi:hypothetical protein
MAHLWNEDGRTELRPARPLLLAIAGWLAAGALLAADGVVLHRKVTGDEPVLPPATGGGAHACPKVTPLRPGDKVDVLLTPQDARRDEPSWSLLLRREEKRAYLLFHRDHTYNVLRWPVEGKQVWGTMRCGIEEAGEGKLFALTAEGPVSTTMRTVAGRQVTEKSRAIADGFQHRSDVRVQLLADTAVGGIGGELETLLQRLRGDQVWLPLTEMGGDLPVTVSIVSYGPDLPFHRGEDLVAIESTPLAPERFALPTGYREAPFAADCPLP